MDSPNIKQKKTGVTIGFILAGFALTGSSLAVSALSTTIWAYIFFFFDLLVSAFIFWLILTWINALPTGFSLLVWGVCTAFCFLIIFMMTLFLTHSVSERYLKLSAALTSYLIPSISVILPILTYSIRASLDEEQPPQEQESENQ